MLCPESIWPEHLSQGAVVEHILYSLSLHYVARAYCILYSVFCILYSVFCILYCVLRLEQVEHILYSVSSHCVAVRTCCCKPSAKLVHVLSIELGIYTQECCLGNVRQGGVFM